jgi:hypothetical protein
VTLNEFLDLVFTHNDMLSGIDITKLDNQIVSPGGEMHIMEEMKKKVERTKKLRPMNQWKFFLQKNLNNIA